MSTTVHLRRMRWWDLDAVLPLEQALFPSDAWSAEAFWSELARPDTRHYVVAEAAGAVVGYAGLLAVGPTADVQTVAVAPDAQGRGVGTALLGDLLATAARRGCTEVLLEVRAGNDAARRLYERAGFERIATRRRYYPDGADADVLRLRGLARYREAG